MDDKNITQQVYGYLYQHPEFKRDIKQEDIKPKLNPTEIKDMDYYTKKGFTPRDSYEIVYRENKYIPKALRRGYLGAAFALPTLYSILRNPAYSMQQKAENIIGEGMNYIPILGDLSSPTATDEEMHRHYEEWVKQGRPNYQRGN